MTDSRMLLQASDDSLDESGQIVIRCPRALAVSIEVAAAMSLVPVDEFVRRVLVQYLLAEGLAVDLTPEVQCQIQ